VAPDDFEKPVVIPLVRALTVTPTVLGVPYMYFVFIGMVTAIFFLVTKNLLYLLLCIPIYLAGRILVTWDKSIFEILGVKTRKCPPINTSFWRAKSYRV
jgi:type IV secretion system protein VirB3